MSEAKDTATKSKERREKRKVARKKRADKLANDVEFRKAYFEGKSKRSAEKKVRYKKRHTKKV